MASHCATSSIRKALPNQMTAPSSYSIQLSSRQHWRRTLISQADTILYHIGQADGTLDMLRQPLIQAAPYALECQERDEC